MSEELKPAAVHEANVFLPGGLGPVRREVVLAYEHDRVVDALRAELSAIKGVGEAVAEVSAETFSSDGTSDIITCNLPIGTKLYTRPPVVAEAEPVKVVAYRWKKPIPGHMPGTAYAWFFSLVRATGIADTEPLMTVAQHERIMAAGAAKAEGQVGEVVGYQVGDQLHVHRDDAIRDSVFHSDHLDVFPIIRQSASGAVPVPRELLRAIVGESSSMDEWDARKEIRALLAKGAV